MKTFKNKLIDKKYLGLYKCTKRILVQEQNNLKNKVFNLLENKDNNIQIVSLKLEIKD